MEKNRKCRKVISVQPQLGCRKGFVLQAGGDCVRASEDDVITRCPKLSRQTSKGCVTVEKLDVEYSKG